MASTSIITFNGDFTNFQNDQLFISSQYGSCNLILNTKIPLNFEKNSLFNIGYNSIINSNLNKLLISNITLNTENGKISQIKYNSSSIIIFNEINEEFIIPYNNLNTLVISNENLNNYLYITIEKDFNNSLPNSIVQIPIILQDKSRIKFSKDWNLFNGTNNLILIAKSLNIDIFYEEKLNNSHIIFKDENGNEINYNEFYYKISSKTSNYILIGSLSFLFICFITLIFSITKEEKSSTSSNSNEKNSIKLSFL